MASPTIRRRQLGKQLRRLREAAGKTPKEAAEWVDVTTSTISKIEKGRHASQIAHVRLLLQCYGVESPESEAVLRLAREANQRGWWTSYGDTVPDWFRDYIGLESDAEEIWTWDPELLHGLLQTADYVKAVRLAAKPDSTDDELQRSVDLRQARQDRLTRSNPPRVHSVVSEGALRRLVGGADVMRKQLRHLAETVKLDAVTIQVLPFSAGAHAAMVSPFTLLRFPEEEEMNAVYLENERGALYLERPGDLGRYSEVFRMLTDQALSLAESAQMLSSLMKHL